MRVPALLVLGIEQAPADSRPRLQSFARPRDPRRVVDEPLHLRVGRDPALACDLLPDGDAEGVVNEASGTPADVPPAVGNHLGDAPSRARRAVAEHVVDASDSWLALAEDRRTASHRTGSRATTGLGGDAMPEGIACVLAVHRLDRLLERPGKIAQRARIGK